LQIGLGGFIEDLMRHVLGPLAALAYPEWGGAVGVGKLCLPRH